jgi:hypothetical protein
VYDKLMIKQNFNSMEVDIGSRACTEGPTLRPQRAGQMVDVAGIPWNF